MAIREPDDYRYCKHIYMSDEELQRRFKEMGSVPDYDTLIVLAELNGVSLHKICDYFGFEVPKKNKIKRLEDDRIMKLYSKRMTDQAMADLLGYKRRQIAEWREDHGLPPTFIKKSHKHKY